MNIVLVIRPTSSEVRRYAFLIGAIIGRIFWARVGYRIHKGSRWHATSLIMFLSGFLFIMPPILSRLSVSSTTIWTDSGFIVLLSKVKDLRKPSVFSTDGTRS